MSAEEVASGTPRGAWYENRYGGKKGAKPAFIKYSSANTRKSALAKLCECGLDHPWEGAGYPTYHGGGRKQLHHIRTSANTMVSDWLFDEMSVREGVKNQPSLDKPEVMEAFKLAGKVYDMLLTVTGLPRMSIVSAYTSHLSDLCIAGRDWREGPVVFEVVPPEYADLETIKADWLRSFPTRNVRAGIEVDRDRLIVTVPRGN